MRRADPSPTLNAQYVAGLTAIVEPFGVSHTGVASAEVLSRARAAIDDRIDRGLTNGMQFTFRNPARSTDPRRAVAEAKSVFVAARPYLLADAEQPTHGPHGRVAKYAWADHYAPLRAGLAAVVLRLRKDGFRAVVFADDNSIVDREVAYRAGIGWFGKNANLLVPGAGSWFVLGCVVTTAALPINERPVDDGCGSCRRCIDGCPTGAIIEPGVIDAGKCLAWIVQRPGAIPTELRSVIGDRIYGCDDCQDVCPPTIRLGASHQAPPVSVPKAWLSVVEMLQATDAQLLAMWGRWYLADRDPRWIRRNALVVLGNIGDRSEPTVRAILAEYMQHPDDILREHAEWAAGRLQLNSTEVTK